LLALGLRSHTDIPALKGLEEWIDTQKEMGATPHFKRMPREKSGAKEKKNSGVGLSLFYIQPYG
jgi:hypothetical protein